MENTTLPTINGTISSIKLDPINIVTMIFWSLSLMSSLCVLVLIKQSRHALVRAEFYILLLFNIFLFLNIFIICVYFPISFFKLMDKKCDFGIGLLILTIDVSTCCTLIYYSLYQISLLSRDRFFLRVFHFVHNLKHFFIFELSIFLICGTVNVFCFISLTTLFNLFQSAHFQAINSCETFVTRFILLLVYSSASIYVIITRLVNRKANNMAINSNENKRLRRNFRLMLKFLIMPILLISYYIPKLTGVIIQIIFETDSLFVNYAILDIFDRIGDFLYLLQPFVLIFVHNVLKKAFLTFVLKCFNRIFRK